MNEPSWDIPARTRRLVVIRSAGRCEICSTPAVLEFHRTTHEHTGHETPAEVLAVCSRCHVQAHTDAAGDAWDSPDDMAAHWSAFHEAMENE
jgi:hypothetical protein